ncbi:MAG: hypothetical protein Q7U47_02800 [Paludibacter sp.]|nr:hypothetical protein [Paludibacter sp.]
MKLNLKRFDHFIYGFIPGLLLPLGFIWLYLNRFYPEDIGFLETVKKLYPNVILGKLLLLSIIPDLVFVFLLYKTDSFKIAIGFMLGGIIYLMASMFML